jgi:hypothetical protein
MIEEKIVIAYIPGAGGHRLIEYLINRPNFNQTPMQHHHVDFNGLVCHHVNRSYLKKNLKIEPCDRMVEVTHCLNSDVLREKFPGRKIYKIKSNFYQSILRQWLVFGIMYHHDEIQRFGKDHMMKRFINIHCNYYQETLIDWQADRLFDVTNPSDPFTTFMHETLASVDDLSFKLVYRRTKKPQYMLQF